MTIAPATNATARRWRRVVFPLLAMLLGLVLALVGVEVALRVVGFEPTRKLTKLNLLPRDGRRVGYHCYPSNPDGEFIPAPDVTQGAWKLTDYGLRPVELPMETLREVPYCVEYDISPQGFRDRERNATPAPGVLRIALVGDSFVFGEGVRADGTLPAQLQGRLGDACEVLNCGRVGDNTAAEISTVYEALLRFEPQRVLMCFLVNDIALTPELDKRQKFINDFIIFRDTHLAEHQKDKWYAGPSLLLRWIGTQLDLRRAHDETLRWYLDSYDAAYNAENIERLSTHFLELTTLPRCRAALVVYPLLENLGGQYPLAKVHDQVHQLALDAGLPAFDLEPAFVADDARALWAHEADHHPNRRAHERAAATIAAWLNRDLPGFLAIDSPATESSTLPSSAADDPGVMQAMQLAAQGQLLPARRQLLLALRRNPHDAAARANLGYVSFLEGRMTDAMFHYGEALRLRPEWPEIEINLAAVLATHPDATLRDPDRAVGLAERACGALESPPLTMLDTLVLAYGEAERFDEAIAAAERTLARAEAENQPAVAAQLRTKLEVYRQRRPAPVESPVSNKGQNSPHPATTSPEG